MTFLLGSGERWPGSRRAGRAETKKGARLNAPLSSICPSSQVVSNASWRNEWLLWQVLHVLCYLVAAAPDHHPLDTATSGLQGKVCMLISA